MILSQNGGIKRELGTFGKPYDNIGKKKWTKIPKSAYGGFHFVTCKKK